MIWSLVKDEPAHGDGAGVARSARRAAVSRTLHVEAWGDPARRASSASTASPGTAAARGELAEGWLAGYPRARARPARPRLLAVRAALEHRRARRRCSSRRVGTEPGGLDRPLVRRAARLRGRRPPARARRAARAPRPGDPDRPGDRAARGRERPRATGRTPRSRRASSGASSRASSTTRTAGASSRRTCEGFLVADEPTAAGATATARRRSSPPTARWRSAPPPFEAVRIPTLLVLGRRLVRPYDHLLDAHRAALGDLLEVVTVPGGHTVLWDALEETGGGDLRVPARS